MRLPTGDSFVYVIERAVTRTEKTETGLLTCQMRGWVELAHTIPSGELGKDGTLPSSTKLQAHYRLTDSGWSVIHRSHGWAVLAALMSFFSFLMGLALLMR